MIRIACVLCFRKPKVISSALLNQLDRSCTFSQFVLYNVFIPAKKKKKTLI